MEKVRKSIDVQKKGYCIDFKKGYDTYAENPQLTVNLSQIAKQYSSQLEQMEKTYEESSAHIEEVSCNALGYLPKKLEKYKKQIVLSAKDPECMHKIKDFEFDRIEYTSKALLHFFNAQMAMHAKALEGYASLFDALEQHNEGEDVAQMYQKSDWAIQKLRENGYQIKK